MSIEDPQIIVMDSNNLNDNFESFLLLFAENTRGHVIDQIIDDNYIFHKANQLFDYLEQDTAVVYGLFLQHKLRGFIWSYKRIFLEEERLYINALIIDKEYRGKGYGKLLVKKIEEFALSIGIKYIDVSTATFKEDAIQFYQSLGYTPERIQLRKSLQHS